MFFPLFLQIAPILRYVDSMRYGLQSRKFGSIEGKTDDFEEKKSARVQRIKNYKLMVYEDSDATLLRLFECFMESAPQLILQVCLEVKFGQNWIEFFSWLFFSDLHFDTRSWNVRLGQSRAHDQILDFGHFHCIKFILDCLVISGVPSKFTLHHSWEKEFKWQRQYFSIFVAF